MLTEELLEKVVKPGQYLGNEWGAWRKPFEKAKVRLAVSFPDLYELGMSNFGLKILYQIVNSRDEFIFDRAYAPGQDLEEILRQRNIPLWGWETRQPLKNFELVGFSLQYELTYTNVLNVLELADIPVFQADRQSLFPLIFGGGPSSVNPEPMAVFMDFFIIGDGEDAIPQVMELIDTFKRQHQSGNGACLRRKLLLELASKVPGVYVPSLYAHTDESPAAKPVDLSSINFSSNCLEMHEHFTPSPDELSQYDIPQRVLRQVMPLTDSNQPTASLVPYLALIHDREVLEVRRGCDRGCRFCQPGYTFLPVRERSTEDLVKLSTEALSKSGHQEYSMLSLCVSDYTSLHESVRALNQEHSSRRSSLSFPSQRADRMNLDLAEELKTVRKSGITLAPEAGSERLRAIINKGLSHQQIISAIEAAYQSGWQSVKLYFMCGLPMEEDDDLAGIIELLKEATQHCRVIRKTDPARYKREIEFTCTISNFVPKPFTPFQWFGQITPSETARRHQVLRQKLRDSGLRNVQLNMTDPAISLLESVISRGDRRTGLMIYEAWRAGATFDAWDEKFKPALWQEVAKKFDTTLEDLSCLSREVGSEQPWDVVHIGLNNWWLVKEWQKAVAQMETAPCTENLCHACGVCTELDTTHELANPKPEVMKRNPFVKELSANKDPDHHPSLFFTNPPAQPANGAAERIRFTFTKVGELRFISHLDLQHLLARAARRAALNISYTQGFNPSPKLNLGAPLPLFQESLAEVAEIDLASFVSPEQFILAMNDQLPAEIRLTDARIVSETSHTSLASVLGRASYQATLRRVEGIEPACQAQILADVRTLLPAIIEELLSKPAIEIEVAGKDKSSSHKSPSAGTKYRDIKPGIISLELSDTDPLTLQLELSHGSVMHVKPHELLKCLQPKQIENELVWRIVRTDLKTQEGSPLFSV